MLWERTDPEAVLPDRFGIADAGAAAAHVREVLAEHWAIGVLSCDRVVMSDQNLLVWVGTDAGRLVVKACVDRDMFDRLGAIAEVVVRLGDLGLPVAPPLRTDAGAARALTAGSAPLSVVLLPEVAGDLVDPTDPAQLRATGRTLAQVHEALAGIDVGLPGDEERPGAGTASTTGARPATGTEPTAGDDRPWLRVGPRQRERAPRAAARLDHLLADLPPLDVPDALVHGDVRGANVLVDGDRVSALLDHDSMARGSRVHDLAGGVVKIATRFRTWDPAPPGAEEHLLTGYRSVTTLTDVEGRWLEAALLAQGIGQIPPGADPAGWADAVERGL